jgi:hypothetical protein
VKIPFFRSSGVVAACVSAALAPLAHAAISIQSFSAETNDRFANDPSFIADAYDWSGVGRSAGGQWVVMLSGTVFLSAKHAPASGTITFFPGNDPGVTPVTRSITTAEAIGATDLWIGQLDSPLPGSIATYNFVTIPLTEAGFGSSTVANQFSYMSGHSPTTSGYGGSTLTNQAVGTNRAEGFQQNVTISGSTGDVLLLVQNLPGYAGYSHTTYEADINAGDSGSPLMFISGGDLVVAGIAWASGTTDIQPGPGETIRNLSIYTYLGNYSGQIQDYIDAAAIPEPSVAVLGLLSAGALLLRRRR